MTQSAIGSTSAISAILAKGEAWNTVGLFIGTAIFLALATVALFFSIKGLASPAEPDIVITNSATGQSTRGGKGWLVLFVILGIVCAILGVVCLVAAIKSLS